jgi:hypothetical protein
MKQIAVHNVGRMKLNYQNTCNRIETKDSKLEYTIDNPGNAL